MGRFGRRKQQLDGALPFLTVDDAAHLRRLAADAFARAGVEVVIHDDHLEATGGMTYGLWNLAATCHEAGPSAVWPPIVDSHVARLLSPPPRPADLSADELVDLAVLRLVPADQFPEDARARMGYATEVADGLLQVLVADFPLSLVTLRDDEVERAGYDRLLAAGRARLLAENAGLEVLELDNGARLETLVGDSVYVASRLLVLPDVLRALHGERTYPDGVLVAVPDRHTLTLHVPVDAGVVAALQAMAGGTASIWASAPGGVSPSVYWWHDGALTTVSRVTEDGRVAVEVHPELGEVLNRLAAL